MLLGCHVSFTSEGLLGSAKDAYLYGANTFMFYTGAPQNTIRKPLNYEQITAAHQFMEEHGIILSQVVCHAPYIISFLKQEIDRCISMGVQKIVVHPGSAVGISHEEDFKIL